MKSKTNYGLNILEKKEIKNNLLKEIKIIKEKNNLENGQK